VQVPFVPHADSLAESGGRCVPRVELSPYAVHAKLVERQPHQLARRLGGVAVPVKVRVEHPADLRLPVGNLADADEHVTDHKAVKLDGEHHPVAVARYPRGRDPVGDEHGSRRLGHRVRGNVPADVGPAPVGQDGCLVAVPERPQHQPLGAPNQVRFRRGR